MDLWQLKIFCKVVEKKSFSKAGEIIHITQPTVSSHIKDLETHFECRLIDRLPEGAVPTKAGELLYEYATKMLALGEETRNAIHEFHGNIRGTLVLGGSTIPGVHILPDIVTRFIKKFPEVTVSLRIGDTVEIIEALLCGDLELGVVGARTTEKRLVQEEIVSDEMRLIIPSNHRWAERKTVSLSAVFEEPFIVRETGSGTLKSIRENLEKKGCRIGDFNVIAEIGSTSAVIQCIKSGMGVSILSVIAVREELKRGTLKALAVNGIDMRRYFYLTRDRNKTLSPVSSEFLKFI